MCTTLFRYFLATDARLGHESSLFDGPALWSWQTQHKNFLFFFLTKTRSFWIQPQKILPKFDKGSEIE